MKGIKSAKVERDEIEILPESKAEMKLGMRERRDETREPKWR